MITHLEPIKDNTIFLSKKFHKQRKFAKMIRQEIANSMVKKTVYHPMIENLFMTVQSVDVSIDLRYAVITVSFLRKTQAHYGMRVLNKLAHSYRKLLAHKLSSKTVPRLKFTLNYT